MTPTNRPRFASFGLTIAVFASCILSSSAALSANVIVPAEVFETIESSSDGRAYVVVVLTPPSMPETLDDSTLPLFRAAVAAISNPVIERTVGPDFTLSYQYAHVAGFTGWGTRAAIEALARDPAVVAIGPDTPIEIAAESSVPFIGADTVQTMGYTGSGVTIAVLDTGVETTHPALAGNIAPGAWHFLDNGQDVGPGAEDTHGHGTHVAGIIASNGAGSAPIGVAPGAQILPVQVLATGSNGQFSDVIAGVDYVVSVKNNYAHLAAINFSIATPMGYPGPCDTSDPLNTLLAGACDAAHAAGITIFGATGNRGECSGLGSPACLSSVIAVAAVYEADLGAEPDSGSYFGLLGFSFDNCSDSTTAPHQLICFSRQGLCNDLAAPGRAITSTSLGGGVDTLTGTSQAAPHCAATLALMCERAFSLGLPAPNPDEALALLRSSGQPAASDCVGFPEIISIDALAAVDAVAAPQVFVRGDCNADATQNVADAVFFLSTLFGADTVAPACQSACDSNDDGMLDLADAITLLSSLFGNPPTLLPPPSTCDLDPTTDALPCWIFEPCP